MCHCFWELGGQQYPLELVVEYLGIIDRAQEQMGDKEVKTKI